MNEFCDAEGSAFAASHELPDDEVVLLDDFGRPSGRARKSEVHGSDTPLHLAVSCYVVRADGRLLITRRAATKRTFPGVWTNACCGHLRPGERLDTAVRRHLFDELNLAATRLSVALPDFAYRASMADGCTEHELCPVFVVEVDHEPVLHPQEADAFEWLSWTELRQRAHDGGDLSPWFQTQVSRLSSIMQDPLQWVRSRPVTERPADAASQAQCSHADPFALMGDQVESLVNEFLETASDFLSDLDPLATELAQPIRSLFASGGKRLRPCLVFCGYESGTSPGETPSEDQGDLANLAAAVEMLHTFALLHDDVMDRSPVRRGAPSAQFASPSCTAGAGRPATATGSVPRPRWSPVTLRSCGRISCSIGCHAAARVATGFDRCSRRCAAR